MTGISVGKALGYATLPGILPRVKSLFLSGFGNLTLLIALVYSMVRLIPEDHPFLDSRNAGKYGIRHVIALAMNNLEFRWRNIDQIIVFFVLMVGSTVLVMYVVGLLAFLMVTPVMAATWFKTMWPQYDVAFLMLDQVFGVPGIYNSDVTTNTAKYGIFPNNFQVGLQSLFQFYSMGLFLISVFIFLYYMITIIAETSFTGTPFGKRFNNIWVPLRVIAALGLLMPWSDNGLNSAQYIVLYTAKYGSGMATNAWITYNSKSTGNPIGLDNVELITKPAMPDYSQLVKNLLMIRGCITMYDAQMMDLDSVTFSQYGVAEFLIKGKDAYTLLPSDPSTDPHVMSRFTENTTYEGYSGTFLPALNISNGGDITIVFGEYGDDYGNYPANIFPACGEVVIPISGQNPEALYTAEAYMAAVVRTVYGIPRNGAPPVDSNEEALFLALGRTYFQESASWRQIMRQWGYANGGTLENEECFWDSDNDKMDEYFRGDTNYPQLGRCDAAVLDSYWRAIIAKLQRAFENAPLTGYDYLTGGITAEDPDFSIGDVHYQTLGHPNPMAMDMGILTTGWGGAGLWYNRIAEKNGSLMGAVGSVPYVKRFPHVMEEIKEQRLKSDAKVEQTGCEIYSPNKAAETSIANPDVRHQFPAELGTALFTLCNQLNRNEMIQEKQSRSTKYTNPILNIINALFGADTFFNLLDNKQTHPMSFLVTLGRTLIDKAIFNLVAAAGTSVAGGINQLTLGKGDPGFAYITMAAGNLSKAFVSFGLIAIVSGVMLFYVLPFLPFMYFFFAVGRWVKTIFEAMVGVPLWALAHLSLKGPGLPGSSASAGYFLILEIFIRPVVTVISLIAAFSVFAAMVYVLNLIFSMATANVFGVNEALIETGTTAAPPPPIVIPLPPPIGPITLPGIPSGAPVENVASIRVMRDLVDQLFLTIMYVIVVYIIGTSCFKLIDLIPDNIIRWIGAGVKTWGGSDNADELVDQTGRMIALPTYVTAKQIGQAITSFGDAAAQDAAEDIKEMKRQEEIEKAKKAREKALDKDGDGKPDAEAANAAAAARARESQINPTDPSDLAWQLRNNQGTGRPAETPAAQVKPAGAADKLTPQQQLQQAQQKPNQGTGTTPTGPGNNPPPGTPPKKGDKK